MSDDGDLIERLYEALVWCGGSADFAAGGRARRGWAVLVMPLLLEVEQRRRTVEARRVLRRVALKGRKRR